MEDFQRINELTKQKIKDRKRRRMKQFFMHTLVLSACIVIFLTIGVIVLSSISAQLSEKNKNVLTKYVEDAPEVLPQFLTINEYSRPGIALEQVRGIVIHYTANPGTTAMQNRNYFEGLAESKETKASSHFIIGLSGEIIQCIPLSEIAYASNNRNIDTISIECCIDNEAGKFNEKTYASLIHLTAWLVGEYNLTMDDVIRHYDVSGKNCPKYFVEHESAWVDFKVDVEKYIDTFGKNKEMKED